MKLLKSFLISIILIGILASVVSANDDYDFLSTVTESSKVFGSDLNSFGTSAENFDFPGLKSASVKLSSDSLKYYMKLEPMVVSSKYQSLKTKYLNVLDYLFQAGESGTKAVNDFYDGNYDSTTAQLELATLKLNQGIKLINDCNKIVENLS